MATFQGLRESVGRDSAFLAELVTTFAEEAPGQLALMRSATDEDDPAEVRRAAHTLKSNAATFGLMELAPLCRDLEHRAAAGDLSDATARIDQIDSAITEALAALEDVMPRRRPDACT